MAYTKSFTVDGQAFSAAQASAVRQDELLGVISLKLYTAFQVAAKTAISNFGVKECAFMLMAIPHEQKETIVEILKEKVFLQGTEIRVSAKDFQGRMVAWNTLLAELLLWNLSDFFSYLSEDLKAKAAENQGADTKAL